jgi:glycosyltransferase involved in cell wall biosynthesis
VKIIEAFGMGLPVVSTRLGIEGLAAVDGTHAVIADDVDGLIAGVDRLAPLDFRRSLTIEARRLWERSFDPELMGRRMMDVYESVVAVTGRHG